MARAAEERAAAEAERAAAVLKVADRRFQGGDASEAIRREPPIVVEMEPVEQRPPSVKIEAGDDQTPVAAEAAGRGKNRKKGRRRGERTTDYFDPRDTGFAAVVAQLDEITRGARPKRKSGRAVN